MQAARRPARRPHHSASAGARPHRPDIRCEARLTAAISAARCQLMVGHEGPHTTLGISHEVQVCWIWDDSREPARSEPYRQSLAAGQPWAPGLPAPEFTCTDDRRAASPG